MCDGILISSVCTSSISDVLCLFQDQEPGQEQGNEAFQPPLQGQGHDVFQPPNGQARNRPASSVVRDPGALANRPAAAGIFLFSPNL